MLYSVSGYFAESNHQGSLCMKIKIIAVTVATLLLGIPAAQAENFYVLGSIGQSKYQKYNSGDLAAAMVDLGATGVTASTDDSDTGYKLQLGYRFNEYFAVEGGYVSLGKATGQSRFTQGSYNESFKADGINVDAVGSFPLGAGFAIFGKLGAAYTTLKADGSAIGAGVAGSASLKESKVNATFGAGLNYDITDAIAVRAEYERFKVGDSGDTGDGNIDLMSLGVAFKF